VNKISIQASEKQRKFIRDLVSQRDITPLPDAQIEFLSIDSNIDRLNKDQASNAIKLLLECDKKAVTTVVEEKVEVPQEGYFFIIDPTDDKEKFFRVKKGKEGSRWEGFTFLDVQASDYFYPVKNKEHRDAVFAQILLDPISAMNMYGLKLGRCGVCNRVLTDRDSRLRGIGPICAARINSVSEEDDSILRQLGLMGGE
jgi:hypothetical protein